MMYCVLLCNKELNVLLIDLVWENSIDALSLGVTFGPTMCDLNAQSCK